MQAGVLAVKLYDLTLLLFTINIYISRCTPNPITRDFKIGPKGNTYEDNGNQAGKPKKNSMSSI